MGVTLSAIQFFLLLFVVVVVPIIGYFLDLKFKKRLQELEDAPETQKRKLVKTSNNPNKTGIIFRSIDWSILYSGWLKGQALNFEKEKIPLICVLKGIEQKGAWSQPVKIGVNPLITVSKNYIEKFGKAAITVCAVSRDDIARNITWGLSSYLNVIAGRVLVLEINQKNNIKKPSARINIGNQMFDDLPDPRPSEISNVDFVAFDQAYTWPEDILTIDIMNQFVKHYLNTYNLIFIVTPPVVVNGFARKAASCSNCCILVGSKGDDQALLIDAYQRIIYSGREIENQALVVWGVSEKSR